MALDPAELSKRERQIMEVIYAAREASANQVVAAMSDPPTQTAVRTLLGILERKGHLTHIKRGRQFIYRPTHPRRQAARSALRRLLATFFDGSVEHALASYIADPKSRLSDEQLQRLGDLIDQARRDGTSAGK
ncbi:MAG TPA: BlaI/MecI/CopY family transcriptional regulator [Humisphaera sp.]|jgi:predicted transcriptional regulator|nr:BlaI/MecI/CopY family transcriptional regulator [Humisphaera sp.]